jgi:cytoskeleton protein RodZ
MALLWRFRVPSLHEFNYGSAGLRSAGEMLRRQREALGLELRDVAAALKIKPAYLAALEDGRTDLLPGPAYALGFVRAYAQHLQLDGNEMLRRFKFESAALEAKPDLAFPMPLGEDSIPQRSTLLVALILALCGYGTWYYLATGERTRPERVTELPDVLLQLEAESQAGSAVPRPSSDQFSRSHPARPPEIVAPPSAAPDPDAARAVNLAGATASPPESAPARAGAPSATAAPLLSTDPPLRPRNEDLGASGTVTAPAGVVIRATANSWIQIRETGRPPLFTGVLKAGESYRVPDRSGVTIRTRNAGGIEISVDGQPTPLIAADGVVRDITLQPQPSVAGTARGR